MGIFFSNGSTKLLPRIIGEGRAKELMLLGNVVKASEGAYAMGLIRRVCPRDELDVVLRDYADKLVSKEHFALRLAKRNINVAQDSSINDTLYAEAAE